MLKKAESIAAHITSIRAEIWVAEPPRQVGSNIPTIHRGCDPRIKFDIGALKNRIYISPNYPTIDLPRLEERPKPPTFSIDRDESAIAKTLCAKFIPQMIDAIENGYRLLEAEEQMTSHIQEMTKRVSEITGIPATGDRKSVRGAAENNIWMDVMIHPGNCYVNISYLPWELAAAVAFLVASYDKTGVTQQTEDLQEIPTEKRIREILGAHLGVTDEEAQA